MLLTPPPSVTNCHTYLDPPSVTYFMDGPKAEICTMRYLLYLGNPSRGLRAPIPTAAKSATLGALTSQN